MAVSLVTIQNSLSAGELAPDFYGRTDLPKWRAGTTTCRNFYANYRGGVSSRAGLAYVGTCLQAGDDLPPRDIPFQFSLDQGYVLEFGNEYIRFKSDGSYITENPVSLTSVSSSAVFTTALAHGYSVGDWVYDNGNIGFSGLTWIIDTTPTTTTFTVKDLFGNAVTTATASVNGSVARIYTLSTPYQSEDLPYLKYSQSADVMTLTCVNQETSTEYPPYNLTRLGQSSWTLVEQTFLADISPPSNVSAQALGSSISNTWYTYVVTSVNAETGEESVASTPVSVQNCDIALILGSNIISWTSVTGASSYNIYAATPTYGTNVPVSSLFGFIGTALGTAFTDTNITPDFTRSPPKHANPFVHGEITDVIYGAGGSNYSQQTVSYSITTATGSGFSGVPVVTNGAVSGFVIYDHGHDYQNGDIITFSDSGGGLASGTVTFSSNPADGNLMVVGGIAVKWSNDTILSSDQGEDFIYAKIEATKELTAQSLANKLNASQILSLSVATYSVSGAVMTVKYKTPGTTGNAYTLSAGTSPVVMSGANLTGGGTVGTGATATLAVGPQQDTYPAVSAYFQQRRVYANSLSKPDTYWMSQPGLYSNMDSSIPVVASDSITGTPWAQQVNGIQWIIPMPGGLVVLTGKGAWQVSGGQDASITPSNQTAIPQAYNGSNATVPPITINYDILYVQSKGSICRSLAYDFFTNIYTGVDLTIFSNHLFTDYQIVQWAWAEEPYKIVWVVRNDGVLLSLTYLKEQEVSSWCRHDTNGFFVGVCSITEPPVDAVYCIVKRYVQGAWRYYSERMNDRVWDNAETSFCVDSGLTNSVNFLYPNATLQADAATGEDIPFTTDSSVFDVTYEGTYIRVGGGKALVVDYVSPTEVRCDIIEEITDVIYDHPDRRPVPAPAGSWSDSVAITTLSGLNHLEGLEVTVLADGSAVGKQVVEDGSITLEWPATLITVGLPYTCQVQTMYVDQNVQDGTIQTRRKNISSVGIRVQATRGIQVGSDQPDQAALQNNAQPVWTSMSEVKERTQFNYAGSAIPLYTGDYYKNINSTWSIKGQVAVQQVYPLPANISAIITYWDSGDDS